MKVQIYILNLLEKTAFEDIIKDPDNLEIIKGASTTLSLKIGGLIFSYIFNLLFARLYGAEVMGIYALAITVAGIFSLFGQMGTDTSLVRFTAQYAGQGNYSAVKEIYKKNIQLVIPASILFSVLFYITSPLIANNIFHKPRLIVPLRITSFVIPFGILMSVNAASLRGLKKIKDAFIFSTVLPPFLNLIGLMGLTYFVVRNYLTPIYVNLITVSLGASYSLILWRRLINRLPSDTMSGKESVVCKREILKVSIPMFMTSAMLLIMGWTDTFMLGLFRSTEEVGIYRVAFKMSLLVSITAGSFYSIIAPKFAELYWSDKEEKLKKIAQFSSKLILFSSFPLFLLVVFFSKEIQGIFGAKFIEGSNALIVLALGQFVNAVVGPVGFFLDMTNKQVIVRNAMIIGAIVNFSFNLLLIPTYGILGAAFATLLSTVVWNGIASIFVYKIYGYWIGYFPVIKKTS